ncbi:hypothetical protein RIF29_05153 [Crotalaria pallida]|uniref:RRM domain-containing protein n=1 Tax=Crotalaria pallida TaxID=3830 RepID=A0AAN9J371_CROPI
MKHVERILRSSTWKKGGSSMSLLHCMHRYNHQPKTLSLCFNNTPFSSSSSSSVLLKHKPHFAPSPKRFVSHFTHPRFLCLVHISLESPSSPPPPSSSYALRKFRPCRALAVRESVEQQNDDVLSDEEQSEKLGRPCEVYVCNLPRTYDTKHLLDMFNPHGTVLSVKVKL